MGAGLAVLTAGAAVTLPAAPALADNAALGLGDDMVGVTFECDEPPAARSAKTVVVGGRDTSGMTPAEIDQYVKTQVAAGADLCTLRAGALAGLAADLILHPGAVPATPAVRRIS